MAGLVGQHADCCSMGLERLTHWHAVKLAPAVSCLVAECSLAVVGHGSVKSADDQRRWNFFRLC